MNFPRPRRAARMLPAAIMSAALLVAAFDAKAQSSPPVKLALFAFELEDFSGGAGFSGDSPDDTAQLAMATNEAGRLLEQSGRYRLVDVARSDAQAVKTHSLRWCNGCDAGAALRLGADQSLVGVITRISRTEYTVQVQIRDARSGEVIFKKRSDLRMGANYSWPRGAVALIKDFTNANEKAE